MLVLKFFGLLAISSASKPVRKQNGVWKEFLDFEECEREGLSSDYGKLEFISCGEYEPGKNGCNLHIECNDENLRGNKQWLLEKVKCRQFEFTKRGRAGQIRRANFFVFEKSPSVRVNRLLRPKRTNLCV